MSKEFYPTHDPEVMLDANRLHNMAIRLHGIGEDPFRLALQYPELVIERATEGLCNSINRTLKRMEQQGYGEFGQYIVNMALDLAEGEGR
jgi:hypothetical protein